MRAGSLAEPMLGLIGPPGSWLEGALNGRVTTTSHDGSALSPLGLRSGMGMSQRERLLAHSLGDRREGPLFPG